MRTVWRERKNATSKRASTMPLSDDRESGLPCHGPRGRVPLPPGYSQAMYVQSGKLGFGDKLTIPFQNDILYTLLQEIGSKLWPPGRKKSLRNGMIQVYLK